MERLSIGPSRALLSQFPSGDKPIMLSYEGGNHYNSLVPHDHCTIQSRPGVAEMMTLSATIIENVRMMKIAKPKKVTSEELNIILEKKIK